MNTRKLVLIAGAVLALCVQAVFGQSQTGSASGTSGSAASSAASVTASKPETIQDRKENQQDRIAQGVKSGELTPGETAKLEKQQQGINREERGMREADGGKLTKADRAQVNQQQNRASRNIYNKKHNGATTGAAK